MLESQCPWHSGDGFDQRRAISAVTEVASPLQASYSKLVKDKKKGKDERLRRPAKYIIVRASGAPVQICQPLVPGVFKVPRPCVGMLVIQRPHNSLDVPFLDIEYDPGLYLSSTARSASLGENEKHGRINLHYLSDALTVAASDTAKVAKFVDKQVLPALKQAQAPPPPSRP